MNFVITDFGFVIQDVAMVFSNTVRASFLRAGDPLLLNRITRQTYWLFRLLTLSTNNNHLIYFICMQKMSSKRRREIPQTAGFVFVRHESPSNLPSAGAFYNGCQILLTSYKEYWLGKSKRENNFLAFYTIWYCSLNIFCELAGNITKNPLARSQEEIMRWT